MRSLQLVLSTMLCSSALGALTLRGGAPGAVTEVIAVAAHDTSGALKRTTIKRRAPGPKDVDIDVQYCGICHSDLHQICGEWPQDVVYPMVPGHEVVGVVKSVGPEVSKWKVGDRVGVGCMVDSCKDCKSCERGLEQYCKGGFVATYNSLTDWNGKGVLTETLEGHEGKENVYGGYSEAIVVDEEFVLKIPDNLDLAPAAPLLCAGITTYSPLAHWGALEKGKDMRVGVVGFGGLGHMAVKLSIAMGNQVTVFSTSDSKKAQIEALGAKFVCSKDPAQMKAMQDSQDLIIDTVSALHNIENLLACVDLDGTLCLVGIPSENLDFHAFKVIGGRKSVAGSLIGGIPETQAMLDFCGKHGITADINLIHPKELNHAMVNMRYNSKASERVVIDIKDGMKDGSNWEVEPDDKVSAKLNKLHPQARIVPSSAKHPDHEGQGKC